MFVFFCAVLVLIAAVGVVLTYLCGGCVIQTLQNKEGHWSLEEKIFWSCVFTPLIVLYWVNFSWGVYLLTKIAG